MIEVAEERRELTDAEAIERSLRNPEAFVAVFERHFDVLHRYLRVRAGVDASDDLVAATFETAFKRRGDYDRSRPDARPWLFGIALNVLRRERRDRTRSARALSRLVPEKPHNESTQALVELEGLLRGLVPQDRDLLLLHACLDFSYEQCAEALGVPVGTVRSRLHRLRARLRRQLESPGVADDR